MLFAGLYWGADSARRHPGNRNRCCSAPRPARLAAVIASSLYAIRQRNYQGFADVTALVAAAGNGVYGVANIQASLGPGKYAGWSLAVAYRNPAEDLRSLRIYDGFGSISSGTLAIPMSGFETPHSGIVHARIGAIAYEGDRGTVRRQFPGRRAAADRRRQPVEQLLQQHGERRRHARTAAAIRPTPTCWASTSTRSTPTGLFGNGATSTTLTLTTTGDAYYPGVITFTIDLYAPKITTTHRPAPTSTAATCCPAT